MNQHLCFFTALVLSDRIDNRMQALHVCSLAWSALILCCVVCTPSLRLPFVACHFGCNQSLHITCTQIHQQSTHISVTPVMLTSPAVLQEEEEERRREEEDRQKQEDTERRKAERLERRAQLKREGKLLTGKAKKEAERLAAVREQFLKQAGIEDPTGKPSAVLCCCDHFLQPLFPPELGPFTIT